jgi:hypothetical protein
VHVHRETREYNYTLGYEIVSEGRPLKTLNGHGSFMEEDSFGSWAHAGDVFVIKSYAAGFDEKYMVGHDGKQFLFITDSVLISDTRTAVQIRTKAKAKAAVARGAVAPSLGRGMHSVPIYRFKGRHNDESELLFDLVVDEAASVPEFKAQIAARLAADGLHAGAGGAHLRVFELTRQVLCDGQTLLSAMHSFIGSEKFGVSVLPGPEPKTSGYTQVVASAFQFFPGRYELGEEHVEFLLEHPARVDRRTVQALISEAVGGALPAAAIDVACLTLDPRTKTTDTVGDMDKLDWAYSHGALRCNEPITFYFKDTRETEMPMTAEEKEARVKKATIAQRNRQRGDAGRGASTEARVQIRGAGAGPGGESGDALQRSFSSDVYGKMLANPKLSGGQRAKLEAMRGRRLAKESAEEELGEWLGKTSSRRQLAERRRVQTKAVLPFCTVIILLSDSPCKTYRGDGNMTVPPPPPSSRRELEILQGVRAPGDVPERSASARVRAGAAAAADLERLQGASVSMAAEVDAVSQEVDRLRLELGLA